MLIGCVILLAGFIQPLVLIAISAYTGGLMRFVYSALLILINRLPEQIRINGGRVAVLCWSSALFGALSAHDHHPGREAVRRLSRRGVR